MNTLNDIPGVPAPVGAYSQATQSGNQLFCSGQIGIDPSTGAMVDGGVEAELAQVLANISALLAGAGSSPERILMTTIFLAEISDGPAVNAAYSEFVSAENPPARQTVAVKDLPLGARVEISVIAEVG